MDMLKEYFNLQQKIYAYFNYVEDWVVIPMEDNTEMYWTLFGVGAKAIVRFAPTKGRLIDKHGDENYYECPIYAQRFLDQWVYRGEDYTMICADTQCDGNKFLMIFSNDKEIPDEQVVGEGTDLG